MAEVKRRGRVPTGLFIRAYLLEHNTGDHPSEIHRALHKAYDVLNQGRSRRERLKAPTFHSFLRHLHQMKLFGLVELSGRETPIEESEVPHLSEGEIRYYRLTDNGRAEPAHEAWVNWRKLWLTEGYP